MLVAMLLVFVGYNRQMVMQLLDGWRFYPFNILGLRENDIVIKNIFP